MAQKPSYIPQRLPDKLQDDLELQPFFSQLLTAIRVFSEKFRDVNITPLTGTPEGNLVGLVGDLALRTDGGANTTLYVKESGTGSSGWAAK